MIAALSYVVFIPTCISADVIVVQTTVIQNHVSQVMGRFKGKIFGMLSSSFILIIHAYCRLQLYIPFPFPSLLLTNSLFIVGRSQ